MRLTFRAKLMAIVAVVSVGFGLLIVGSEIVAKRLEGQLSLIERQYLPKLVLEPELTAAFDQLRRGFQDAVAAHDLDALAATRSLDASFLERLAKASEAVSPEESAALRNALEEYDAAAYDVSRRLIADETGEALVDAMAAMQAKQVRMEKALARATSFDRRELTGAFAAASQSSATARRYRLAILCATMAVVLALSVVLSRSLLVSVKQLTEGFQRFGEGRFSDPIRIAGGDEWGDLADHANHMAVSLQRSMEERGRIEADLKASNAELEAFSYSVAHDLRAPLRGINGFARVVLEDAGDKLDDDCKDYLGRIGAASERMGMLIDALLALSRVTRTELQREPLDLTRIVFGVMSQLRAGQPERVVELVNEPNVSAEGDSALVRAVFDNLLSNAWKFTGGLPKAVITFGAKREGGATVYFVKDDGAGFDMAYASKLFAPFQRLHSTSEFAGTGVGLATVQRIVQRHGGRIWAEAAVGQGATFYFTLTGNAGGQPS